MPPNYHSQPMDKLRFASARRDSEALGGGLVIFPHGHVQAWACLALEPREFGKGLGNFH